MVAWFGAVRADTADAFRLGGLLAFALAGYALTLPTTPPRRNPSARFAPLAALRQLRSRKCVVFLVCTFGVYLFWPFTTQGTPLLLKQLGVAHAWMMPTLTLAQAVEATTLGLLPLLLPRLGARAVMLGALAAWTLGLFLSGVGRPVGVVVASLPCNGLIVSGFLVVGQMFADRQARPDLRSSMQALLAFVSGLAMLLGHLLLGRCVFGWTATCRRPSPRARPSRRCCWWCSPRGFTRRPLCRRRWRQSNKHKRVGLSLIRPGPAHWLTGLHTAS